MIPNPPGPAQRAADEGPATSRPASLWPETTRQGEAASSSFARTRFDPLSDERAELGAQSQSGFDVCHPALALRALLLVQLVLALVALAGAASLEQWLTRQAVLAFGGAAATGLWLVLACALRWPLRLLSAASRAAAAMLMGGLVALAVWAPLAWLDLAEGGGLQGLAVLLSGLALAGAFWAWLDLRARIWQPANASARLAELQSRIRPHFLFNALNTAIALVRADPERAEGVLEDLAELFRVALADVGSSVSLEDEIALARRYLAIEQIRFGQRLDVQWDIDPRSLGARVPPLVLQPLVENAVRHGIEPAQQGGRLRVHAQRLRGQVVVTVSNTLGDAPGAPGQGMALQNIRERLRLLHDMAAQCDVWRQSGAAGEPDIFHARIVLPAL